MDFSIGMSPLRFVEERGSGGEGGCGEMSSTQVILGDIAMKEGWGKGDGMTEVGRKKGGGPTWWRKERKILNPSLK